MIPDAGWLTIRQFIEDLGYKAEIFVEDEGMVIEVQGGLHKQGVVVGLRDGKLILAYLKFTMIPPPKQIEPKIGTTIPEVNMNLETETIGLYSPDALKMVEQRLKKIIPAYTKRPYDA
jgi:hypothetical protein